MNFIEEKIEKYAVEHTTEQPEYLYNLYRETHLKVLQPIMLSGHLQGRFLKMVSAMIRPKNVLEIGTFTGYSALCFAEGLAEDGKIYTIDINEEIAHVARKYFAESGMENKIEFMIGNALEIIPPLDIEFDLVFIDADKVNYLNYYKMVIDKVRTGGFILGDNALWHGKVTEKADDEDTAALQEFNDFVQADTRVENVLLPLRDGIMCIQKK